MSRNYELMTQLEIEVEARDNRPATAAVRVQAMAVVPILASYPNDTDGKEILRLVQRIFLSANGSAPRQVVICGVDDENGSSSICAKAGRTLAANSSKPVCLVDANVRSPRLSGLFEVEGTSPFSGPAAPLREQCVKVGGNLWLAGPTFLQAIAGYSFRRFSSRSALRNCARSLSTC